MSAGTAQSASDHNNVQAPICNPLYIMEFELVKKITN